MLSGSNNAGADCGPGGLKVWLGVAVSVQLGVGGQQCPFSSVCALDGITHLGLDQRTQN